MLSDGTIAFLEIDQILRRVLGDPIYNVSIHILKAFNALVVARMYARHRKIACPVRVAQDAVILRSRMK